jgi:hypothetical protein
MADIGVCPVGIDERRIAGISDADRHIPAHWTKTARAVGVASIRRRGLDSSRVL